MQYYLAGKNAAARNFGPVCANLLHHGVEMLLKACIAQRESLEQMEDNAYPHDLSRMWGRCKALHNDPCAGRFDGTIADIEQFDDMRYPEEIVRDGFGMVVTGLRLPDAYRVSLAAEPR